MPQRLLESICIFDGIPQNISYHNQRFNQSRKAFWPDSEPINLATIIKTPDLLRIGMVKCRILYTADIEDIQYMKYEKKNISRIKIINTDIDYSHKFEDRTALNEYLELQPYYDDVLLVKNGFITDTTYSNIVLKKDNEFYTPKIPLLNGTKRQHLLDEDILIARNIKPSDLKKFSHFALINAFNDLDLTKFLPIKNIFK